MNTLAYDTSAKAEPFPWDFSFTPNYSCALPLETVNAADLDEEIFRKEFVANNRPCLIKNAVSHWPAFQTWNDVSYLKSVTPNTMVRARNMPLWEHQPIAKEAQAAAKRHNEEVYTSMTFHSFLDQVSSDARQLVLHSVPLHPGMPLKELLPDLGGFKFVKPAAKARMYPPRRAFFYRNSYSDWHFHPSGEVLMAQVAGEKETLLLPPNQTVWDIIMPIANEFGYLYGIDRERFPQVQNLRPFRALVTPGDALYIPVFWWHAVGSADPDFGVTVATTFGTPIQINADLRYPAARMLFKTLVKTRHAPFALGAVTYASLCRLFAGAGARRA